MSVFTWNLQTDVKWMGGWYGGVPLGNFLGFNHQLLARQVDHGPTHLLIVAVSCYYGYQAPLKNAAQTGRLAPTTPSLRLCRC